MRHPQSVPSHGASPGASTPRQPEPDPPLLRARSAQVTSRVKEEALRQMDAASATRLMDTATEEDVGDGRSYVHGAS